MNTLKDALRKALQARPPAVPAAKPKAKPALWILGAAIHEFAKEWYANNRFAKVVR